MADDKKLSHLDDISTISFLYGVDDGNVSGRLTKAEAIAALNAVTEAPANSQKYARVNEGWSVLEELSPDVEETINERWDFAGSLAAKGVCLPAASLSTGFIGNSSVTVNAGNPAAFDYAIDGAVYTDAGTCSYKVVSAQSASGIVITNIGVQPATYIGINENGSVIQSPNQFTAFERRTIASLAAITHVGGVAIEAISTQPVNAADIGGLLNDYLFSVGPKSLFGNSIAPHDTSLRIKRLAGQAFGRGINFDIDPASPNIKDTPEDAPITFFSNYRNAGSGVVIGITDLVDPDHWDDGTGTLNNLTGNDAVAHRIFYFPGGGDIIVQYGQKAYGGVVRALSGYLTEIFEQRSDLGRSIFLGWLILENGTSNLTDAFANETAYFVPA